MVKRRLLVSLCCIFLCLSLSVFVFAVEEPDLDTGAFNKVVSPLGLDTFVLTGNGPDVFFPNPFNSAFVDDGYNLDYQTSFNTFFKDEPEPSTDTETLTVLPGSASQVVSNVYQVSSQLSASRFSLENSFAFTNTNPVLCTPELLEVAAYSSIVVDPNVRYSYRLSIEGTYFYSDPTNNQFVMQPFNQVLTYSYFNSSAYSVSQPMFPSASAYTSLASVADIFVIDKIVVVYTLTSSSPFSEIQLAPAFIDTDLLPTAEAFREIYPRYVQVAPGTPGDASFDLGTFLRNTVGTFLSVEFIPGISLGGIAAAILGIVLFVAFLKIFAGG